MKNSSKIDNNDKIMRSTYKENTTKKQPNAFQLYLSNNKEKFTKECINEGKTDNIATDMAKKAAERWNNLGLSKKKKVTNVNEHKINNENN